MLLVLTSVLMEDLKISFTSLLPILLGSETGCVVVTSLLPHQDTAGVMAAVSALLHLPRLPVLLARRLLDMTTSNTAAFWLVIEVILSNLEEVLEQEQGVDLLLNLLEREQEVTVRVAALLCQSSIPATDELYRVVRKQLLSLLLSPCVSELP